MNIKLIGIILAGLVVAFFALFIATQTSEELQKEQSQNDKATTQERTYLVVRVIDGDTIELSDGSKVRYIGIDTPETVHPSKPVECFGKEASNQNKELVEGKEVRLEKDVSERDKYGRLLRYIYVNGTFVNDYLVRQGYALSSTYPPDVKYQDQFIEAQQEARENNRGLWSACVSGADTPQQNQSENFKMIVPQNSPQDTGIICSYDAYNCSDFSTHNKAQSVYEHCGGVSNDVHRLDRDKDGLACETLP